MKAPMLCVVTVLGFIIFSYALPFAHAKEYTLLEADKEGAEKSELRIVSTEEGAIQQLFYLNKPCPQVDITLKDLGSKGGVTLVSEHDAIRVRIPGFKADSGASKDVHLILLREYNFTTKDDKA